MTRPAAQITGGQGANTSTPTTAGGTGDKGNNIKEERNTFALSVLKKVRTKLDGREPDPLRKSSVQEQGT